MSKFYSFLWIKTSTFRDNFEKLARETPEKFQKLKGTLVGYVASHLSCVGVEKEMLEDVGLSFRDGINLIMLIGQLDGYFVSQHSYNIPGKDSLGQLFLTIILADTDDKRLQNVELALDLVVEAGCSTKVRARFVLSPKDLDKSRIQGYCFRRRKVHHASDLLDFPKIQRSILKSSLQS